MALVAELRVVDRDPAGLAVGREDAVERAREPRQVGGGHRVGIRGTSRSEEELVGVVGVAGRGEQPRVRGREGAGLAGGGTAADLRGPSAERPQRSVHAIQGADEGERLERAVLARPVASLRRGLPHEDRVRPRAVPGVGQPAPGVVHELAEFVV